MPDSSNKPFLLRADQIRSVAIGRGGCIATDLITCGAQNVGFMYRETPDGVVDSGWRFMSGSESEEYMNDSNNLSIYDVNTIANYDPDILPFLDAPIGSAYEREGGRGPLAEVYDFKPPSD